MFYFAVIMPQFLEVKAAGILNEQFCRKVLKFLRNRLPPSSRLAKFLKPTDIYFGKLQLSLGFLKF